MKELFALTFLRTITGWLLLEMGTILILKSKSWFDLILNHLILSDFDFKSSEISVLL